MPLYRNADKLVCFVHIPKTGGSTVEEVLKAAGAAQALKYHKRLGYSNATPQHMDWAVLRHWIPASFYDYAFAVVRNPFARLVSEYRWRGTLVQGELPGFDTWVNRQFDRYDEDPYLHDNHMRPQVEYIGQGVEVFRLEDGLEAPIRAGLERLGLPTDSIDIHHARKSDHSTLTVTPRTIKRIVAFYAKDFARFGYDVKEIPASLDVRKPTPAAQTATVEATPGTEE